MIFFSDVICLVEGTWFHPISTQRTVKWPRCAASKFRWSLPLTNAMATSAPGTMDLTKPLLPALQCNDAAKVLLSLGRQRGNPKHQLFHRYSYCLLTILDLRGNPTGIPIDIPTDNPRFEPVYVSFFSWKDGPSFRHMPWGIVPGRWGKAYFFFEHLFSKTVKQCDKL